jgi:hypothetical protein
MSVLFDGVARKPRRGRGRALLIFIAITFAVLNTPGPTRGVAPQQACCTDFTLSSCVVTDLPAIDCQTAMFRAFHKALGAVQAQADAYVCPQECSELIEVTPPNITSGPSCTSVVINGFTRYYGNACAAGTYRCVPP